MPSSTSTAWPAGFPRNSERRCEQLAQDYADLWWNVDGRRWQEANQYREQPDQPEDVAYADVDPVTVTDAITAEDHALYELSTLTEHRQIRQLQATSKLPAILWCVLLVGGVLTIFSACLFGQESTLMHGIQVFRFHF